MKTLMFAATALLSASMLVAQDMVEAEETVDVSQSAEVAQGEDSEEATDQGEAVAAGFKKTTVTAPSDEFVSAEKIVEDEIKKAGLKKFNRKTKAIVQVGSASIKIKDPATDNDFMTVRSLKATEAYLNAKRKIIEAINLSFKGIDKQVMIAKYGKDPTQQQFVETQVKLEATKAELVKKMEQLDKAEAETLRGATLSERFGKILDGIAKRLDKDYDPNSLDAKKKAVYDEISQDVERLKADYAVLKEQAKKIPPVPKKSLESTIQMNAQMPLLGSTVVAQAESWDESTQEYMVSMAVVWSPRMQEIAESLTTSDELVVGNPTDFDIDSWVEEQDLAVMIGPRSFTDDEGHKIFVGVAAIEMDCPIIDRDIKKNIADQNAIKAVAFSLMSDIESYRTSSAALREYGEDEKAALTSMTQTLSQKCEINLQGCMQATSDVVTHPITGRPTYVSVFYLEPSLADGAQELLENAYAGLGAQVKASQYREGRHAGARAEVEEIRKSKEEFKRGFADGKQNVKSKVQAKSAKPKAKKKTTSRGASSSKRSATPGKSQGGGYSGSSSTIDTDF
jgi:hypothetical protein